MYCPLPALVVFNSAPLMVASYHPSGKGRNSPVDCDYGKSVALKVVSKKAMIIP